MLKLNLDHAIVDECRSLAARIAFDVQQRSDAFSTVSVERAILRLFGLEDADDDGVPLANRVVDALGAERLAQGVCYWIGSAMGSRGCDFPTAARMIREGAAIEGNPNWRRPIDDLARRGRERIAARRREREELMERYPPAAPPWFYCIVATGNIYEDAVQAQAAARQGAQVIAVIRSTAQSLLDYVPHGATTEGFAGTFATQENFRVMREALDEVGRQVGRYILLCNYASGLCMPEIAAMGALERLDMMLNDALYGILFRNINMRRTLTDQFFSRRINGCSGIVINTGEDNYPKVEDGMRAAHTVLASQFINERLAALCGVPEEQMGLGHAFEMDPEIENGFLWELAQAQLSRQIFPRAPLKYMPPTRFKTGDIFQGFLQDGLFNLVSLLTGQHIQLLGMLSEAVTTPGIHDRYLALRNAEYIRNNLKDIADELCLKSGGRIEGRARQVLAECRDLLEKIASETLFEALAKGTFAGIPRGLEEGRGLDGVFLKSERHHNPFSKAFR